MWCGGDVVSVLQCGVGDMWTLWHDVMCVRHEFWGMMWCGGDVVSVLQCGVGRYMLVGMMWCEWYKYLWTVDM